MTLHDREHAIADNVDYIGSVLDAVGTTYGVRRPLVFAGFSQGGAMAYRAAARAVGVGHECDGVRRPSYGADRVRGNR